MEGSTCTFKRGYPDQGWQCFMEANIDNWSKLLSENAIKLNTIIDLDDCKIIVKSFVNITPWANTIKLFKGDIYRFL